MLNAVQSHTHTHEYTLMQVCNGGQFTCCINSFRGKKDYFLEKTMFPEHLEFMCKRVKLILCKRVRVYFCCVKL